MSIFQQKLLTVVVWIILMVIIWRVLRYVFYNLVPDEIGVWIAFGGLACLPIGLVMLVLDKRARRRRAAGLEKHIDKRR